MRVLALETSANAASAAIMEDDILLGEYILNHKKTHSQKIMPIIKQMLTDLELTVNDIDIFAAAVGPGSFTGLRIGVETVKALAHATGKRVVGVGTLEALAYNVPYAGNVIAPLIDARRDNVYSAAYVWDGELREFSPPRSAHVDDCIDALEGISDVVFVGDGALIHKERIAARLGKNAIFPHGAVVNCRASSVAGAALCRAKRNETQSYIELVPFYMKKSQAEREYDARRKEGKTR